jgi:hypothetical protein
MLGRRVALHDRDVGILDHLAVGAMFTCGQRTMSGTTAGDDWLNVVFAAGEGAGAGAAGARAVGRSAARQTTKVWRRMGLLPAAGAAAIRQGSLIRFRGEFRYDEGHPEAVLLSLERLRERPE